MGNDVLDQVRETGVIAIVRGVATQHMLSLAQALYEGGCRAMEVTLNTPGALAGIADLRAAFGEAMRIGAGTVLSVDAVRQAQQHGAQFVVTPHVDKAVIEASVAASLPVFAGAMTPTEIHAAYTSGASYVKVFPSSVLGPQYFKEIRGPFADIPLLAVGGVNLANAEHFLEAGANGFGLGGGLIDPKAIQAGDFGEISKRAAAFIDVYQRHLT